MQDAKSMEPGHDVADNLAKARRAANIGDRAHTILYAQEAVCLSIEALIREIEGLRRDLGVRTSRGE